MVLHFWVPSFLSVNCEVPFASTSQLGLYVTQQSYHLLKIFIKHFSHSLNGRSDTGSSGGLEE